MKRLLYKATNLSLGIVFSLGLALGFTACSVQPTKYSPDSEKEAVLGDDIALDVTPHSQAVQSAESSRAFLHEDLMFNLLAGEFAGVRGQMEESIGFYTKAADISGDPSIIIRAAYIALYAGHHQQAIELTDRWLALNLPSDYSVNRIRTLAFLHLEQLEPSVLAFEKLLLIEKKVDSRSIASLTRILSKDSSPEFAMKMAVRLNQKHPNEPFILLLLAKFEANFAQYGKALKHINQLIDLDEDIADAYLVKAQILAGKGDQKKAVEAIQVAVEKRPNDNRLRLQFARMLVQMKNFKKALGHFLILKEAMPDDENVLLSLGLLSIETDNNDKAKHYLQALINKGFHNQQAHYYLGRIQQSYREDMAAIANYDRVMDGDYWLDARIRAAALLAKAGKTKRALSRLEALAELDHTELNRVKVYLAKGQVLRGASRIKEAFSLYNSALRRSPENTDLLYARALTAEKLDMLDVTESDLKMVIMHEPENASALNALGYTLADRTERLNEARDYILKASLLLPDDPAVLDSLGWVYYRLGQYEAAIKWLSKAFERLEDAEIAAHLGEALWATGKIEEAQNIWLKGQKLNGNQTVLEDTMQRLKK